jgi:tRNA 2-thiouridine synthesizing protein A
MQYAGHMPTNTQAISMTETIIDPGTIEYRKDLDARGLSCPLPILKAKKALAELASGEVLRIVATDTGSVRDFQAFAKQTGNALLAHTNLNGEFTFWLRRK